MGFSSVSRRSIISVALPHDFFRIPTVIVYGSYVRGAAFLSDVDIAVDLDPKWKRASKEFGAQSKKTG